MMVLNEDRNVNQLAFQRTKRQLAQSYGQGRFLAFSQGEVIADASSFHEIQEFLKSLGKDPARILIVQAGVDYLERLLSSEEEVLVTTGLVE